MRRRRERLSSFTAWPSPSGLVSGAWESPRAQALLNGCVILLTTVTKLAQPSNGRYAAKKNFERSKTRRRWKSVQAKVKTPVSWKRLLQPGVHQRATKRATGSQAERSCQGRTGRVRVFPSAQQGRTTDHGDFRAIQSRERDSTESQACSSENSLIETGGRKWCPRYAVYILHNATITALSTSTPSGQ